VLKKYVKSEKMKSERKAALFSLFTLSPFLFTFLPANPLFSQSAGGPIILIAVPNRWVS